MIPIVIEGIVQALWQEQKKVWQLRDHRWVALLERGIGYAWVIGFKMWSIPKYVHTRDAWSDAAMRKKYMIDYAEWEKKSEL